VEADRAGRVLVVDDNRVNRLTLARGVEREGHGVTTAADGQEALDLLAAEPFDLVLLDIVMPVLDGFAVLERLRADAELSSVPVIVISAVDDMASVVRCIEMGAVDYLPKPFDPVLLRARLHTTLERKRLRDLEQAYVRQGLALRQHDKLATLGRLSAGVAHELNNPAAAVLRSAGQLVELLRGPSCLPADSIVRPELLVGLVDRRPPSDPLDRADREEALERAVDGLGVGEPWRLAVDLAEVGLEPGDLTAFASAGPGEAAVQLRWLADRLRAARLAGEVSLSAGRIAEIVGALRSYAYLDRSVRQEVDLVRGIDDTLVVLRSALTEGVAVRRELAPDLPTVSGYGGQLNQVWTNLIDNAVQAMGGQGALTLRAHHDDGWVTVEVEDDGPGIDPDLQGSIFDPFVTTKPPGQGTGLGLSIVHQIVTEGHGGRIEVDSRPGRTTFRVHLPVDGAG
jgi:signal transduction histidine kinase